MFEAVMKRLMKSICPDEAGALEDFYPQHSRESRVAMERSGIQTGPSCDELHKYNA